MSEDRYWVMLMGVVILGIFGFAFSIVGFDVNLAGYAIFGAGDEPQVMYEDFEFGVSDWTLTHTGAAEDWVSSTTDPYVGGAHAESNPVEAGEVSNMEIVVNTSGRANITLSYYRKLVGLDVLDYFRAKYYDGGSWVTLEEQNSENGDYVFKSFNLPASADDNVNLMIKFECVAGAVSEFCRVDNVNVSGNVMDDIAPVVDVVYPESLDYGVNVSELTYGYLDDHPGWCWYSVDGGVTNSSSVSAGENFTGVVSLEGDNDWTVYCNDSVGNEGLDFVVFRKDTIVPSLSVISPLNQNYSTDSVLVNVSVQDDNLESVWFYNGSVNVSYVEGYYDFPEGSNEVIAYANDSAGNEVSVSVSFYVDSISPVVDVSLPEEVVYDYNESIGLEFSASDSNGVADCWYNVDGAENVSLVGCGNGSFDVVGSGNYVLSVYANDSFGLEGVDVVLFSVDLDGIEVNLSEPVGEKDSRTGVGIVYSVAGADECWYNVKSSIGGSVIGNTSLVNCSGSSFDLAADGDYVLNLFVNNSFGSFDFDASNFSVDSSDVVIIDDGGSSGGGGGGGSTGVLDTLALFEIEPVSVIASIGEEKSLLLSVKNVGKVAANKCVLKGGVYVDSVDIVNIGSGEIMEFMFILSVLDFGVEDFNLSVVCLDNVSGVVPLSVVVLRPELDVSIEGISFDVEGNLFVKYAVEPVDSSGRVLFFRILNSFGDVVAEVSEGVDLIFGENYKGNVSIDISEVEEGMLKVAISEGDGVSFVEEDFVYGGGAKITGHALLGIEGGVGFVWVVVFMFVALVGFIGFKGWQLYQIGGFRY